VPEIAESMLAAVYQGERAISVERRPVPPVGPRQVRLEVSHCGVCGTDLHMLYEGWGTSGSIAGHEYSGVVVEVGSEVEEWQEGDRVVGGPGRGCGTCRSCASGRPNLCVGRPRIGLDPFYGAFATYKVLDADCVYRIPDGLDMRTAALTEPVAVALHGIRRTGAGPGQRVLVTGAGPIGVLTVALLRAIGVDDITVTEPSPKRQDLARRVGADNVIDPDQLPQPALPMEVVAEPFDLAFECSGRKVAMEEALANLDRAGTLVLSGTGLQRPQFDPNRIILNELVVTGAMEYTPEDYLAALEILAGGRLPTDVILEPEDQPLGRLEWALEQLARGELAGKVLVVPRDLPPDHGEIDRPMISAAPGRPFVHDSPRGQ
jgi:(R,R)-butanediol dehydrogenase/meso-butanediol dehydrogenase/diacetyl reductase